MSERRMYAGRLRTPEQIERRRALKRVENMTPEQHERELERGRERRAENERQRRAPWRRLAKLERLAAHPGATEAEREVARRKAVDLRAKLWAGWSAT